MSILHPVELRADLSDCCRSFIIFKEGDLESGFKIGDTRTEAFDHNVEEGSSVFTAERWCHCRYVLILYPQTEVGKDLQVFIPEAGVVKNLDLIRHG